MLGNLANRHTCMNFERTKEVCLNGAISILVATFGKVYVMLFNC